MTTKRQIVAPWSGESRDVFWDPSGPSEDNLLGMTENGLMYNRGGESITADDWKARELADYFKGQGLYDAGFYGQQPNGMYARPTGSNTAPEMMTSQAWQDFVRTNSADAKGVGRGSLGNDFMDQFMNTVPNLIKKAPLTLATAGMGGAFGPGTGILDQAYGLQGADIGTGWESVWNGANAPTGLESMVGPTTGATDVAGQAVNMGGPTAGPLETMSNGTPGVGDGGAFDQFGAQAYPNGGPQTIYEGMPDQNGLMQWIAQNTGLSAQDMAKIPGLAQMTTQDTGSYQFPWGNALGALFGVMGNQAAGKDLQGLMKQIIDSDLWRTEQPKYFQPAYDAATKGIGNTAYGESIVNDTSRKLSSQGYNMSGNVGHEIAKGLNAGTTNYMNAIQPFAMGRPGNSNAMAQVGQGIAGNTQNQYGNIGFGLGSIFNGQQPTDPNKPKNGNLMSLLNQGPSL